MNNTECNTTAPEASTHQSRAPYHGSLSKPESGWGTETLFSLTTPCGQDLLFQSRIYASHKSESSELCDQANQIEPAELAGLDCPLRR